MTGTDTGKNWSFDAGAVKENWFSETWFQFTYATVFLGSESCQSNCRVRRRVVLGRLNVGCSDLPRSRGLGC
jgi:hypothetical protein